MNDMERKTFCAGAWTATRSPTSPRRSPTSGSCLTRWRSSLRLRTRWWSSGHTRSSGCGKGLRTMNEYIDRDALRQAVLESQHNNPHPRGMAHIAHDCEHAHFVAMIARFPAADVAPVVHARWVSVAGKRDRICSRCLHNEPYKNADDNAEVFEFCPHCGAKMDGGAE